MEADVFFMRKALDQAEQALSLNEVPVGAVVVKEGKVIAAGYNTRETKQNALHHAEISAIDQACRVTRSWRLDGCQLYVTLEPCAMCCGAIINARINRVVFGAYDAKCGCCGSLANLFALPVNHHPVLTAGVLQEECAQLLTGFFIRLRNGKPGKTVNSEYS